MIRLFKNLLIRDRLPSHIHFHRDEHGHQVWCDEAICRPANRPVALPFPPFR